MAYEALSNDSKLVNYSRYDESIVPHVMQNSNWDCGIACITMTLQALGKNIELDDLRQQCHVNSIWTIDLAFLLRNYVEDFTYYTSFLGSRKEYQSNKFYQENFSEDEKRVNKLFAIAKSCNVHVVRMLLPIDDFKRFLFCKKFAIITLVNARLLRCQICQEQKGCSASMCVGFDSILERMKGYEYIGHFITLINYDPNEDAFIYRDPAQQDKICVISADTFDAARQSIGTDNDCIMPRNFDHYPKNVGILGMEMYFPSRCVDQTEMEAFDGVSAGKYTIGLGQQKMAFIDDREDIQSICLTAVQNLMETYKISYNDIGRLEVGTETIIDKSKAVKTVLMTLFAEHGNTEIEGIDTTNACYGGANAFFNAVNWVESSSWDGRYAIVVAGDLALYASGAARPTSGAGVVAVLIGENAPIVVERGLRSTHMEHAYDFYKPDMHSEYPIVDGKFSNTCYIRAFDSCYNRYMNRLAAQTGNEKVSMEDVDYVVCHSPYAKLVNKSFARAAYNDFVRDPENPKFADFKHLAEIAYAESLENRDIEKAFMGYTKESYNTKVGPAAFVPKHIGNMYAGAVWAGMASLISEVPSEQLQNKRVLLYAYGSGLAASMISFKVVGNTEDIRGKLNLRERLSKRTAAKPEDFAEAMAIREKTHNVKDYSPIGSLDHIASGVYYIDTIDDKWRRFYKRKD